jgi:hypothetical protein
MLLKIGQSVLSVHKTSHLNFTLIRNFAKNTMGLPRVFFDMSADGQALGRIIIEVSLLSNSAKSCKICLNLNLPT